MPNTAGETERERRLHPPFTQPDPGRRAVPEAAAAIAPMEADASGLPPIEDFVDELPSIQDFLMVSETPAPARVDVGAQPEYAGQSHVPGAALEMDAEGWASADWQSYNWSGLATLAAPPPEAAEAHHAWSSTNWDAAGRRHSPAAGGAGRELGDEVADALDEMARRIRSGELSLEQFRGVPPEAAVAAAFAALVRAKG